MTAEAGLEHNPLITVQALQALHEQSYSWALSCCRYDRGEAADVLQQSYVELIEGSARFDGASTLKTWLFAVIRNVARQRARRQMLWKRWVSAESAAHTEVDAGTASSEPGMQQDQRRRRVLEALAALSARQRETLELTFYRDLTIEQAAQVMGISVGSARVHYERGKRMLAARLERDLIDD